MAKKSKEVKQWITIKGNHIPVYEGQTVDDAAKNFMKHESTGKKERATSKENKLDTNAAIPPRQTFEEDGYYTINDGGTKRPAVYMGVQKSLGKLEGIPHSEYATYIFKDPKTGKQYYIKDDEFDKKPDLVKPRRKKSDKTEQVTKAIRSKTTKQNSISNAKYADDEHHPTEMSKVKKGDFFKLSNKPNAKVYVRDEYDKSEKAYWCYEYEDVNNGRYMKKNKTVYTGFTY